MMQRLFSYVSRVTTHPASKAAAGSNVPEEDSLTDYMVNMCHCECDSSQLRQILRHLPDHFDVRTHALPDVAS